MKHNVSSCNSHQKLQADAPATATGSWDVICCNSGDDGAAGGGGELPNRFSFAHLHAQHISENQTPGMDSPPHPLCRCSESHDSLTEQPI